MLYLVKLFSFLSGSPDNPFVNVFTYVSESDPGSSIAAAEIADALNVLLFSDNDDLLVLLSPDTTFYNIEVTSPFDPTILANMPITVNGQASGENSPRFVALEWWAPRKRTDMRGGFKRFGVTTEGVLQNQGIVAGAVTYANAVADQLSETLVYSVGGTAYSAVPAIVKRIPYETESGSTAYRLPENEGELVYFVADNWVFNRVTTQNSRKR